jgi:hypothetical protein
MDRQLEGMLNAGRQEAQTKWLILLCFALVFARKRLCVQNNGHCPSHLPSGELGILLHSMDQSRQYTTAQSHQHALVAVLHLLYHVCGKLHRHRLQQNAALSILCLVHFQRSLFAVEWDISDTLANVHAGSIGVCFLDLSSDIHQFSSSTDCAYRNLAAN